MATHIIHHPHRHHMPRHHAPAKQSNLLLIKGVLAIVWGIGALFASLIGNETLIFSFGFLNLLASILTFTYININKHLQISHQWLMLEGIVELVAAITFMFFVKDINRFTQFVGYGTVFVVFLQFIYGYSLLIANKVNFPNIASRFANALFGSIVAIILIGNVWGPTGSVVMIGIFSILYGIFNAHFALNFKNIVLGNTE